MGNWSLVCFTLFTQSAIGLVWIGVLSRWSGNSTPFYVSMIAALVLSGAGLLMALAHLSKPHLAPNALRNLPRSWLSREVLLVQAFVGAVALLILLLLLDLAGVQILLEATACLLGGVALFAMIRVYLLKTVPVWNSPATHLEFAGSAILLGGALNLSLRVLANTAQAGWSPEMKLTGFAILTGIVLKISAISPAITAEKAARAKTWYESAAKVTTGRILGIRFALYLVGLLIVLPAISWSGPAWLWSILSLACFGTAEVLGRNHFYQSYRRLGL